MPEKNSAIYWGEGYVFKGGVYSSFDKLSFASDNITTSVLTFDSMPDENQAGFSNDNVAGYSVGGLEIQKLTFNTDSSFPVSSKLSDSRTMLGACESSLHGYTASGSLNGVNGSSKIDKLAFNTESNNVINQKLSKEVKESSGFANVNVAGYFVAGHDGIKCVADITKFNFANNSVTYLNSTSTSRKCGTATVENLTHGITIGGNLALTMIQKLCFTKEDNVNLVIRLHNKDRINSTGVSYRNRGFVMGGRNNNQSIECIQYNNESISYLISTISEARDNSHGFENKGS